MRVRSALSFGVHKYFQENGFNYVNTPIVTGSDAEGAGEMFRVTTFEDNKAPVTEDGKIDYSKDFFGKETNLNCFWTIRSRNLCDGTWEKSIRLDLLLELKTQIQHDI